MFVRPKTILSTGEARGRIASTDVMRMSSKPHLEDRFRTSVHWTNVVSGAARRLYSWFSMPAFVETNDVPREENGQEVNKGSG
jgi:hypothetical protein